MLDGFLTSEIGRVYPPLPLSALKSAEYLKPASRRDILTSALGPRSTGSIALSQGLSSN